MNCLDRYKLWKEKCKDEDLLKQLSGLSDEEIEDCFYRDLEFGTGGLRGILGVGSNRMNVYVVDKASQGLANYINKNYFNPSIAVGYDTRINSDLFAKIAAEVFSYNNIKVYLYDKALPVPCLSYATRYLHCSAGIMITASHNPSQYNGYKVYGDDGGQITTEAAKSILDEINVINEFEVNRLDFSDALSKGRIEYIKDEVIDNFINEVKKQSFLYEEEIDKNIGVVYTPLNGTGLLPVTRVLNELGYSNIILVDEQKDPDGNFPTCPYPNPEVYEAMELGIRYAKDNNADILIATDPDCDRVGVAIKNDDEYRLLSGNEVGVLLFNYICEQKAKHHKFTDNSVLIKTIVTTDLADKIASSYGIKTINVLTGYKFIGEQIGLLEKENRLDDFVFSFEESDGYLSGTYVRDKDGVNGACLVCEMYAYYKTHNISLLDKLNEIYDKYGYYYNSLSSFEFKGPNGFTKMKDLMEQFRNNPFGKLGGSDISQVLDYSLGINNLPKSNVLKYVLSEGGYVVIRPSGTEPKLKIYICICGKENSCKNRNDSIINELKKCFN